MNIGKFAHFKIRPRLVWAFSWAFSWAIFFLGFSGPGLMGHCPNQAPVIQPCLPNGEFHCKGYAQLNCTPDAVEEIIHADAFGTTRKVGSERKNGTLQPCKTTYHCYFNPDLNQCVRDAKKYVITYKIAYVENPCAPQ